jgi:hypothetical protein
MVALAVVVVVVVVVVLTLMVARRVVGSVAGERSPAAADRRRGRNREHCHRSLQHRLLPPSWTSFTTRALRAA